MTWEYLEHLNPKLIWEDLDLLRMYTKPEARPRVYMLVSEVALLFMRAVDRKTEQDVMTDSPTIFPNIYIMLIPCMVNLSGPGAASALREIFVARYVPICK